MFCLIEGMIWGILHKYRCALRNVLTFCNFSKLPGRLVKKDCWTYWAFHNRPLSNGSIIFELTNVNTKKIQRSTHFFHFPFILKHHFIKIEYLEGRRARALFFYKKSLSSYLYFAKNLYALQECLNLVLLVPTPALEKTRE